MSQHAHKLFSSWQAQTTRVTSNLKHTYYKTFATAGTASMSSSQSEQRASTPNQEQENDSDWSRNQKAAVAVLTGTLLIINSCYVKHALDDQKHRGHFPCNVLALTCSIEAIKLVICIVLIVFEAYIPTTLLRFVNMNAQEAEASAAVGESIPLRLREESLEDDEEEEEGMVVERSSSSSSSMTAQEALKHSLNWQTSAGFLVACALYAVDNNCWFLLFLYYRPSAILVMQNLSYLVTGLFRSLLLAAHMNCLEWHTVLLISFGAFSAGLVAKMEDGGGSGDEEASSSSRQQSWWAKLTGELLLLLLVLCSSLAAVWSEKVMRKENRELPITVIGVHYYGYGVMLNVFGYWLVTPFVAAAGDKDSSSSSSKFPPFFHNLMLSSVLCMMLLSVAIGFCYAFMLRYLGSLNKIIVRGSVVVVVYLLEIVLFGHDFSMLMFMCICSVITAVSLWSQLQQQTVKQNSSDLT